MTECSERASRSGLFRMGRALTTVHPVVVVVALCAVGAPASAASGFYVTGVCYVDLPAAARADCASYPRTVVTDTVVTTWSCVGSAAADNNGLAVLVVKRSDTNYSSAQESYFANYSSCDPDEQRSDLSMLWGAGLAAVAAVWAVRQFVYRLVANQ